MGSAFKQKKEPRLIPFRQLFCPIHINRPLRFVVDGTFACAIVNRTTRNLMRNAFALFVATLFLFLSSCHRPVAYFQPTHHQAASRLPVEKPLAQTDVSTADSLSITAESVATTPEIEASAVVSLKNEFGQSTTKRVDQRIHRIKLLLASATETTHKQPDPKPKKKLKLGNQIRQSLGMKLRPELNWWQRISWKLKASVIILIVAVVFAILHVTILAIIFGIVGAFLMISGLKRSFKVRRPWF